MRHANRETDSVRAWIGHLAGLVAPAFGAAVSLVVLPDVSRGQTAAEVSPRSQAHMSIAIADSLFVAGALRESYQALQARLAEAPSDYEARWRATRGALGLGIAGATREERRNWLREADAHGRELLRVHPNTADAMAWAAAGRGRRALAEDGMRTVARLAEETWILTGRILVIAPDHPIGNQVRGKLHQEVARSSTVTRFFARLLIGNDLVTAASDWDGAELHLRRAVAADPGLLLSYLDLGETYGYQRKWAEAEAIFRRGLTVPVRYPVDERFKVIMREWLVEIVRLTDAR